MVIILIIVLILMFGGGAGYWVQLGYTHGRSTSRREYSAWRRNRLGHRPDR